MYPVLALRAAMAAIEKRFCTAAITPLIILSTNFLICPINLSHYRVLCGQKSEVQFMGSLVEP